MSKILEVGAEKLGVADGKAAFCREDFVTSKSRSGVSEGLRFWESYANLRLWKLKEKRFNP